MDLKYASWVLFHLCAAYGDVIANVELTGPGREVMIEFKHLRELLGADMNRGRVIDRNWEDAAGNARWFLYHKADSPGPGYVHNFESNWRTKQELLHGFRGAYIARELEIKSLKMLNEMKVVVIVDDRIGAPDSSNPDIKDDRVFSCGSCGARVARMGPARYDLGRADLRGRDARGERRIDQSTALDEQYGHEIPGLQRGGGGIV